MWMKNIADPQLGKTKGNFLWYMLLSHNSEQSVSTQGQLHPLNHFYNLYTLLQLHLFFFLCPIYTYLLKSTILESRLIKKSNFCQWSSDSHYVYLPLHLTMINSPINGSIVSLILFSFFHPRNLYVAFLWSRSFLSVITPTNFFIWNLQA